MLLIILDEQFFIIIVVIIHGGALLVVHISTFSDTILVLVVGSGGRHIGRNGSQGR